MLSMVLKPSLIVLCDMNRVSKPAVPALSLVPLAREPPKGCWPGIAPVHWSLGCWLGHAKSGRLEANGEEEWWGKHSLYVEVASREAQFFRGFDNGVAVASKEGTGQGVLGRFVDEAEHGPAAVGVRVHVDADKWSEDLLFHEAGVWIRRLDDGRSDEEADGVVAGAAGEEGDFGRCPCFSDVLGYPVVGTAADDGTHEVGEGSAHGHGLGLADHGGFEGLGEGGWDVDSRQSAALLALILEGCADAFQRGVLDVCCWVD